MLTLTHDSVVAVPFHDDTILAVRIDGGDVVVVIKRICESLKIDFSSQLQKLKSCHWATVGLIPMEDTSGHRREVSVLPLDRLPMWLATIDTRKVGESLRPKLRAYQVEACGVLSRHFFGETPSSSPVPVKDPILAMIEAAAETRRCQLEHERRLAVLESETGASQALAIEAKSVACSAEAKADAALAGARGDTGYVTLLGFCNLRKIKLSRGEMAKAGLHLRKACDAAGIEVRTVPHETYGKVNLWPVEVLERWSANLRVPAGRA